MPILDLFWSMLVFFLFVAWIWVLISVIADIFRNRDMGGGAKAFWLIFVMIIPWLGVLIYLLSNGDSMAQRSMEQAEAQQEAARAYIQDAAGTTSAADEIQKLAGLKDSGVISEAEFAAQKAKLLA